MADTIILTKLDERADQILDQFETRTGLAHSEDRDDRRTFEIAGREHEIDVVQTLTAIDEHWPAHVGLRDPD
jgi:hypothetical protein